MPNPRVVITGAAGALGRAFSVECADHGFPLYLTDTDANALSTLADALRRAYSVDVDWQEADLTDPDSREEFFQTIRDRHRSVWMLVNVAGLDYEGAVSLRSRAELRRIIRLNVEATVETTNAAIDLRDPVIPFTVITVASLAAFYPIPLKATYSASKTFLLQFSLALREELRESGGSATVLCPSGLRTRADAIASIDAQGAMGRITTVETPRVVAQTVRAALRGRAIVIPGVVNQLLRFFGALVPPTLVARVLASRWRAAQDRREATTAQRAAAPLHQPSAPAITAASRA